jgi:hypothetical protein
MLHNKYKNVQRSVLLVKETGIPGENHRTAASHWQTLLHNVVSSTPRHEWDSNSQRVIQMFYSGFFTFCVLLSLYILFFYASVMYDFLYLCVLVTSNPFCSPDIPSNACHSFVVYNLYNSYYIIEHYNVIIHHNYD